MSLETPITKLKGTTGRQKNALRTMGIETVRDLIFYFPARHEDFSASVPLAAADRHRQLTVVARVQGVRQRRSFRKRLAMVEAVLVDGSGELTALWFNQPYVASSIKPGQDYRFAGKISKTRFGVRLINPLYEPSVVSGEARTAPFLPVYPLSGGISQTSMRRLLRRVEPLFGEAEDHLPPLLRRKYDLADLVAALRSIHFPRTAEDLAAARRRIGFDEMFRLQLTVGRTRLLRGRASAAPIPFDAEAARDFVGSLPFSLTTDQRRAAWDILRDLEKPVPMHRLLNGDVGSGKTIVAAMAALGVFRGGKQSAFMAPTEILARQHFATLKKVFAGRGLAVALWTNACKRISTDRGEIACRGTAEARRLRDDIADGRADIVIGTHALVEESLRFNALALAVIDEQHRFGVRTRRLLCEKGGLGGTEPHLLSMTATPIPRSLALTAFGDLDISLLAQKPQDRRPVITRIATARTRGKIYEFVRREVGAGRQAFVVCPLIDPSDVLGASAATEEYERLREGDLAGVSMGLLHGKMASAEQERVMDDFVRGRRQVLVATSVVEVGVDVPNATVMCIEGAERFGLAQLHQFRGRVGRGRHQAHCFLMPSKLTPAAKERLEALAATYDGFILAEKDLATRGPGDFLGVDQSGFPELRIASFGDLSLIRDAREAAAFLLDSDPDLAAHPTLAASLAEAASRAHFE